MNDDLFLLKVNEVAKLMKDSKDCLLGVSGGIDSMVLLYWMAHHRESLPALFRVMHVDHGIDPNSADWGRTVQRVCGELNVPCEIKKVSLDGRGNNLEFAARRARYQAFCESGADTIIVAHHANDQVESFLLKLFRGSGVKGLKAMSHRTTCWYDNNIIMLRPLLTVTRYQIETWAESNGIVGIDDPSNQDDRYDRNYLRNQVWPVIQDRFDIADINSVRSIQHLGEAWELTTALADIDIAASEFPDKSLDWRKINALGYLRIKNLLLRILEREGVYGFSVNHIEQFAHGMVDADMDSRNELSLKGFKMNKIGKKIVITRDVTERDCV